MKLPRDLSGRWLTQALIRHWDYREVNRVGSHIILQTEVPEHHRLSVLRSVAEAKKVTRDEILASI